MWVEAGFDPDAFWEQTPRSLQVAMEGVRKRLEREAEDRFRLAYETAALSAAAQAGKLKKYDSYMKKQPAATTPKAMVAALKALGGGSMTVRKIERPAP